MIIKNKAIPKMVNWTGIPARYLTRALVSSLTMHSLVLSALELEEVTVTAEKREQSLQDVPVSIVAMDKALLDTYGIDDVEDLGEKTPNLITNEYFGIATTFRAFIRGVGAVTVETTQDPAVALYVDGIYVGSSYGGSFESSDLERVEVLRGSQGTLYGRNATGGAINLISKKPLLDEWAFHQGLLVGNYGKLKINTNLNIPIGERAALRISLLDSKREGIVENTGKGDDYGVEDREGLRLALRLQPVDSLTVDLVAEQSSISDTTQYSQVISGAGASVAGTGTPIMIPLGPPGSPTVDVYYVDPVTGKRQNKGFSVFDIKPDDNTIKGVSLSLAWEATENTVIKSITGYRDVDATQFSQLTGTIQTFLNIPTVPTTIGPNTLGMGGVTRQLFSQWSQEFQWIGTATVFGGHTEYISGLYFYQDKGENHDFSGDLSGPKDTDWTRTNNTSVALYGQVTYTPPNIPFHITVGGRYSQDKRQATRTNLNTDPVFVNVGYDKSFSNVSPSLTLAYDLSDNLTTYAKVVTGYRSGGTSTLSASEALFRQGADAETMTSYESGFKSDIYDKRIRINGALFMMDYHDYQVSIQSGQSPSQRDLVNVRKSRIQGVEVDIVALLSEFWRLSFSGAYLDSQIGANHIDPATGAPDTLLVDHMPYAPELSYTLALDYQRPIFMEYLLAFNLNYAYQSESGSGVIVGTSQTNDARGLWDASLSISNIPLWQGEIKFGLWAKNITDEAYSVSNIGAFELFGAREISPYGDPRTFGLFMSYDY